jgi:hypothetical protein
MHKPVVPNLKIKPTGRKTGTSRYYRHSRLSETGTKAEIDVDDLLVMKFAKDLLDKAHAQGLFYYDGNRAAFADGKVSVCH